MSTLLLSGCVGGGTATSTADAEKEINKVLQFQFITSDNDFFTNKPIDVEVFLNSKNDEAIVRYKILYSTIAGYTSESEIIEATIKKYNDKWLFTEYHPHITIWSETIK